MSLTPNEIRQILDILAASAWDEATVSVGEVTIAVARNGATLAKVAPVAAASAAAPVVAAPEVPHATPTSSLPTEAVAAAAVTEVTSPTVGVFWRAPEPGAAPFAEVGQRVEAGKELCIVEVMKLMNRIQSPVTGVVTAIHVANGDAVEFGSPLFSIAPE